MTQLQKLSIIYFIFLSALITIGAVAYCVFQSLGGFFWSAFFIFYGAIILPLFYLPNQFFSKHKNSYKNEVPRQAVLVVAIYMLSLFLGDVIEGYYKSNLVSSIIFATITYFLGLFVFKKLIYRYYKKKPKKSQNEIANTKKIFREFDEREVLVVMKSLVIAVLIFFLFVTGVCNGGTELFGFDDFGTIPQSYIVLLLLGGAISFGLAFSISIFWQERKLKN